MSEAERSAVFVRSVVRSSLREAVQQCLSACDWEQWLPRNCTVVIKPNLCTAVPEKVEACNADVRLMEVLCEALLTRTGRITIGESGHLRQSPWQAYAASGYVEMARRLGVELVNFSESPVVPVRLHPVGEVPMPRRLLEAEVFINVPVLKTHALTYFTGALKNQWGCVPDCRDRLHHHRSLNELLSSLLRLLRPKFVLMDGIVGMEGRGPVNGVPRRLDAILASRDAVALDAAAMRLVGLRPERARHVVLAAERGLGRMAAGLIVEDSDCERPVTPFTPPPRDFANGAMFFVSQYPWFVNQVLANDRVYYPIRDMVQLFRKAKLLVAR